jgi:glutaredoxin-like protein NrdH
MEFTHVSGKNAGTVTIYTLSTCPWCKKVKAMLNEKGIEYDYVDVDMLHGDERQATLNTVEKWNPSGSFPTIVINNKECIVGFDEEKIKKALKL